MKNRNILKRIISGLLASVCVLSYAPVTIIADDAENKITVTESDPPAASEPDGSDDNEPTKSNSDDDSGSAPKEPSSYSNGEQNPDHVENGEPWATDDKVQDENGIVAYDIFVGGVQVTEENCENVLADGTVSYNIENGILTLNGTNITGGYTTENGDTYGIYAIGDLTIEVREANIVEYDIFTMDGELTLDGYGMLTAGETTVVLSDYVLTDDLTIVGTWDFVNGAKLVLGDYTVEIEGAVLVSGSEHSHNENGDVTYAPDADDSFSHIRITACLDCPVGYVTEAAEPHTVEAEDSDYCVCGLQMTATLAETEETAGYTITFGGEVTVPVIASGQTLISFVPEFTHTYSFTGKGKNGYLSGTIYDADMQALKAAAASYANFAVEYMLEKGKTYYLGVKYSNNGSGDVTVQLGQGVHDYTEQDGGVFVCTCGVSAPKFVIDGSIDVPVDRYQIVKIPFKPEYGHSYVFTVTPGDYSAYAYIYDDEENELATKSGSSAFSLEYTLQKDETYYIALKYNSNYTGTPNIKLSLGIDHVFVKENGMYVCGCGYVSPTLVVGEPLTITANGKYVTKIPFEPEYTHEYVYSSNPNTRVDGYIYDADGNELVNVSGIYSFSTKYTLEAGNRYYLCLKYSNSSLTKTTDILLVPGAHMYEETENGQLCTQCKAGWSYEDGTLTIFGVGNMAMFNTTSSGFPWASYKNVIETVIIEEGVQTIERSAFSGYPALKNVTIPDSVTTINMYAFYDCNSLEKVTIPGSIKVIESQTFENCDALTEVIIEEGVTSIGQTAFGHNNSLEKVLIPGTVTAIGNSAFYNCYSLSDLTIKEGVTSIGKSAFDRCNSLVDVVIPDSVTTISDSAFYWCRELERVTIPENLTYIGTSAFYSCSKLDEVVWNARDCRTVPSSVFSNCGEFEIVIGEDVDYLSTEFWTAAATANKLSFMGPNYFTTEALSETNALPTPLNTLMTAGEYYVDNNGALYRIENGEATLLYCPAGVETLNIPAELPEIEGKEAYPVTSVASHALIRAEDLTAITFESPQNIKNLSPLAMADCPTLESVNGVGNAAEAKALFTSALIGIDVFRNTGLENETEGTLTTADIIVVADDGPSVTISTNSATYYTNQTCTTNISITNNDNSKSGHRIRVYFQFSDYDGELSYEIGNHTYTAESGKVYPFSMCETEGDTIYYIEIPQPEAGDTISLNVLTDYPSPSSDGGSVKIWGTVLTAEEAETLENGIVNPVEYHQSNWITKRDDFPVTKTKNRTPSLIGDGGYSKNIFVENLSYTITLSRNGDTLTGMGKDFVTSVEYTDILTLPEKTKWRDGVLDAVAAGNYSFDSDLVTIHYYVTVNGEKLDLCRVDIRSNNRIYPESQLSVENGNIVLKWKLANNSTTDEIALGNMTLTYGSNVICIDDPDLSEESTYTFTNNVTALQHYTHSEDVTKTASAENTVTASKAEFKLTKSLVKREWEENISANAYLGETLNYVVKLNNPTAMPYRYLTKVTDELPNVYYIKFEDIQAMFNTYADNPDAVLSILISNATLCEKFPSGDVVVKGTDGKEYPLNNATTGAGEPVYSEGMSNDSVNTNYADILITWQSEGILMLTVKKPGENGTVLYTLTVGSDGFDSLEAALVSIGYLVTSKTKFTATWTFADDYVLYGGEEKQFYVLSTLKDSFMYTDADRESYVFEKNAYLTQDNVAKAYYTDAEGNELSKSAKAGTRYLRDFELYKSAYINDEEVDSDSILSEGDIITYSLYINHDGTAYYDALPVEDYMQGGQVLLVTVDDNEGLQNKELQTLTVGDTEYYVLNKVGIYKDVVVGELLADSVTVSDGGSTGLNTLIHWYMTDIKGDVDKTIEYKALASPTLAGCEGVVYYLNNMAWAGDHQSHRLYDFVGLEATRLQFNKRIVTSRGTTPAGDELAIYSPMKEGETITYRFTLQSIGNNKTTITGDNIYDILPVSIDKFWTRGDAENGIPANITVSYADKSGVALEVNNGDAWFVTTESPDGSDSGGRQYLRWPSNFEMEIDGTAYIYVTLTCPTGDTWDAYAAKYSNSTIQNDLYVYKLCDTVYHNVALAAEAVLQKGVYLTGFRSTISEASTTSFIYDIAENSRLYYANDDAYTRLVSYYIMLYNGGDNRLYINDMQDILPNGFTFYGMHAYTENPDKIKKEYTGLTTTDSYGFMTAVDTSSRVYGSWLKAGVSAAVETLDDGRQKITFSLTDDESSSYSNLMYDELVGKYYLEPGQGVKFAYACRTNNMKDTEDEALNRVVMPYYDYTSAGVTVYDELLFKGQTTNFINIARNDGKCKILTNDKAEAYGFTGGQDDTQWLSSDVTVLRGKIVPGIQKSVADGSTFATAHDTIAWSVRMTNDGEYPITDYTFTDVMKAPYQFVGDVKCKIYHNTSNVDYIAEATLFSIVKRDGDTITLNNGTQLTVNGDPVNLKVSVTARYGTGYNTASVSSQISVSVTKDENGNEVLTIHFTDGVLSIPEGGYMDLILSTKNNTNGYENKVFNNTAYITPKQPYDENLVGNGKNERLNGQPSVKGSSQITVYIGYATSSEKIVTQHDCLENTACSSDAVKNYIVLPTKDTLFDFTLNVHNVSEKAMESLVIIDNLPEKSDHSTFDDTDARESEFKVSLAADPNFTVTVTTDNGTVTLAETQYSLQFSSKTQFNSNDKRGEDDTNKWFTATEVDKSNDTDTDALDVRSFRIIINDPNGTLIPANAVVTVQFTAEIVGDSKPGQTAWNSFGYHYKILGQTAELEAMPLKVGVKIPTVPEIQKKLTLEDGTAYTALTNEEFRFIIYTDNAKELQSGYTEADLAYALSGGNKPRQFTYAQLTIAQGESESEKLMLEDCKVYSYKDGMWTPTEEAWTWVNGEKYTVVELPMDSQDEIVFGSINDSKLNGFTFTYDHVKKFVISAVNFRESWNITLNKTDYATGDALAGAVFGLYSPSEADKISDAYEVIGLDTALQREMTVGETTYYLTQVNTSDANGQIAWTHLLRTEYYIYELKAPEGYTASTAPIYVQSEDYDDISPITVPNPRVYILPETGGIGIHLYTAGGLLLISCGLLEFAIGKRRRRRAK